MRVSLSVSACEGTCSKCGAGPVLVLPFTVIVDDHAGDADKLCQGCLFDFGGISVTIPMESLAPGPAPRRKALKAIKKDSLAQERDIAAELDEVYGAGATRRQPGSGNQPGAKGDHRVKDHLRVEAKCTKAESFVLKLDELYKVASECNGREKALFVIDYLEPGTRKLLDRFAVLQFHDLKELLHAAGKNR